MYIGRLPEGEYECAVGCEEDCHPDPNDDRWCNADFGTDVNDSATDSWDSGEGGDDESGPEFD